MKKVLIKILVFAFIFLLPSINVKAASYTYGNAYINLAGYTNGSATWYITSSKTHTASNLGNGVYAFWIHQAYSGSSHIHAYCLNVGKTANTNVCTSLTSKTLNSDNTGIGDTKITRLKKLLANATYISGNIGSNGTEYKGSDKAKIIATQILVWEVVEGARTSFASVAPNVYNGTNSAYNKFVKKNSTILKAYTNIVNAVNSNTTAASTSGTIFANSSAYVLPWNGTKYTLNLGSVGKYTTCKSSSSKVTTSIKSGKLTVSTTSELTSDVTITCSYSVGSTKTSYIYYKFGCSGSFQDLVRGENGYTYSQSVKVKTAKRNVKIIKYDDSGKEITGAKFTLKNSTTGDTFTYDLTSASNKTLSITKTGNYILSETTVPNGKQKIPDATIKIDVENGTATLISGGGGLIKISNGDTISIGVINSSKYFYINKRNSSGGAVNGATFQIKNSSGTLMKFNWNGTMFVYNSAGSTTNLVNSSSSSYAVSGLPDGDYSLVEVAVPYPYILSGTESDRTVKFRIKNGDMYLYSTSSNNYLATASTSLSMTNYTTKVIVNKIGNSGVKLSGVSFYLLDSTKTKKIKSTMTSDGVYGYSTDQNSGTEIYTTNASGQITISALPAGTYYFQEFDTGDTGYLVPEGDQALTKVEIVVSSSGVKINGSTSGQITISNAKNEFNFYKIDEDGNYLTGGSFKIQKYDDKTKKYVDLAISKTTSSSSGNDTYKPDSTSDTFTFSINNGIATFIDMDSSTKYKIVELQAPDGFMISNVEGEDQLVIEVDSNGYVKSSTTLVNKSTKISEGAQASAELIVNISTGQNRIRYVLIIGTLLVIITGLFIINRKMRKK